MIDWNEHLRRKRQARGFNDRGRKHARRNGYEPVSIDAWALYARSCRCGCCGEPVEATDVHFDHIIPLSRGGRHEPSNVQVSHSRCNLSKGSSV